MKPTNFLPPELEPIRKAVAELLQIARMHVRGANTSDYKQHAQGELKGLRKVSAELQKQRRELLCRSMAVRVANRKDGK